MKAAAASRSAQGILAYTDAPLVSVDYNHDPHSSIYDATMTKVIDGSLVKVCAWYDNEWGFSNRMLDTTLAWCARVGVAESHETAAHGGSGPARQARADPRGSERAGAGRT